MKLKELCDKITVGHVGPMASSYQDSGIPFLRSLNIKPYTIDLTDMQFIGDGFNDRLKKSKLKTGDVVVVRTGYPGTAAVIPDSLNGANCSDLVIIRPSKKLNAYFLTALFNSTFGKQLVSGNTVGAAQQHFNITVAKELKFLVPSKFSQDKIAAILSAYDELIENNKRRIALLELMAEEIYREWFVRLRFPGHEQVLVVKGVPAGWEVKRLKDVASINSADFLDRNKFDSLLYIDISSVTTHQINEITEFTFKDAPGRARRHVKHGDIIWSSVRPANRAYCLIFQPPENLVVSTGFAVIRAKNEMPYSFLIFAVTTNSFVEQMTSVAKGAAYPATSFNDFEKANLLIPSGDLLVKFAEVCEPMLVQKNLLAKQNVKLIATRDLLLPRLISGKLSVADLDIQFPPSMAAPAS